MHTCDNASLCKRLLSACDRLGLGDICLRDLQPTQKKKKKKHTQNRMEGSEINASTARLSVCAGRGCQAIRKVLRGGD